MTRGPTDCERMLALLREAEMYGVHSHEIRRKGISGNPSQRIAELRAKGYNIESKRENRGKRPGTRYILRQSENVERRGLVLVSPGHAGLAGNDPPESSSLGALSGNQASKPAVSGQPPEPESAQLFLL